jgi:protein gp37
MSANSKIEWTDHTFNPWWGCAKVSPACDNCYAERDSKRFSGDQVLWGVHAARREFGDKHWTDPVKWDAKAKADGVRRRVFCASMADVFDKNAPLGARERLWELIEATPNLDWLLLTKRIGNVPDMIPARWAHALPRNIWIGISVVNQEEADRDVPKLLQVPSAVRFLSMEPLLGPVNLADISDGHADSTIPREYWEEGFDTEDSPPAVGHNCLTGERWQRFGDWTEHGPRIDWVIVGGESGPHARPMHPDWARSLRDQCAVAGVPFLFKQWGEWLGEYQDGATDHDPMEINASPWSVRVGKKAAGRLLDGRTHDEFPKGAA